MFTELDFGPKIVNSGSASRREVKGPVGGASLFDGSRAGVRGPSFLILSPEILAT